MKKSTILIVVILGLCILAGGLVFYFVKTASYSRGTLQSAKNITDVPNVRSFLEGFNAWDIKYVCIRHYRNNEYLLTGQVNSESLDLLVTKHPHMFLSKESYDEPPDLIAQVFQEIPGSRDENWSKQNWLLDGSLTDDSFIVLAMNPTTERFWAVIYVPRLAGSNKN